MGLSNVEVQDVIREGDFSSKLNTMNEVLLDFDTTVDRYKVLEFIKLDIEAFGEFSLNFLEDHPFLKGKGGTGCDLDTLQGKNFWSLNNEERELYYEFSYRKCVAVYCPENLLCFVVDPQGYDYARYVHITAYQNLI
ncbi:hypothetical protein HCA69_15430 [Listeria grandensis]|uniref:Uncharacterized protein n=1 Tax=Listeria grandensis TaxID=1494963 RepID=A0A7X0Y687_9LIST|nr:hypothetical protein [Listeria grandensis]MBC1937760.1 hypothetical protein [Listeria grandensis]